MKQVPQCERAPPAALAGARTLPMQKGKRYAFTPGHCHVFFTAPNCRGSASVQAPLPPQAHDGSNVRKAERRSHPQRHAAGRPCTPTRPSPGQAVAQPNAPPTWVNMRTPFGATQAPQVQPACLPVARAVAQHCSAVPLPRLLARQLAIGRRGGAAQHALCVKGWTHRRTRVPGCCTPPPSWHHP